MHTSAATFVSLVRSQWKDGAWSLPWHPSLNFEHEVGQAAFSKSSVWADRELSPAAYQLWWSVLNQRYQFDRWLSTWALPTRGSRTIYGGGASKYFMYTAVLPLVYLSFRWGGLLFMVRCYCCNLSVNVVLNVWFITNGVCTKNNTHIYVTRTSNNRAIVAWKLCRY